MTTAIYLANIMDAISQLSISGITIKDKDQLSASWISLPNVLYPHPDNLIENFGLEYQSLVQDASGPVNVTYTLNYRYLDVAVGDLAVFPVSFSDLIDKAITIANAMIAVRAPYSGRVLMTLGGISVGPREDPVGNQYFGADIALNILELQN